ncbi:MAG: alpha/beta hydrolase [Elusimicrobiales bacterium]|nr:alpha/beta hydrolase [Elusimicrobiales bacterium]
MIYRASIIFFALFSASGAGAAENGGYTVAEGKLEGSLYKIAVPQKWNNKLLLIAHGARLEKAPLSADFKIEKNYLEDLLNQGWMVAQTSYRRNGIFVTDGVADIKIFFDFISKEYGRPGRTYIEGASMGGKIAVQLAEEPRGRFDGVLAIGAALMCDDNGTSSPKNTESFNRHTFKPNIPVLFFSNSNETEHVKRYSALASSAANTALWTAVRRGHCNVNDAETLKALLALEAWVEKGRKPADEKISIDVSRANSGARHQRGRVYARLTAVDPGSGNLTADATRADLEKAGIKHDTYFNIAFNGKKVKAFLGYHYADVKKGEWISFLTAEDYLRIARNWASAQAELGCKEGDEVYLEPEPFPAKRP